jgi:3-oxoacyl-(acyl-carrier-protein) synthase
MRRVVVTGYGIVSSLGNNAAEVSTSLREGRSGLKFNPKYAEMGMRSQVSGRPDLELEAVVDRRNLRFMGDAAAYSWLSMKQAIEHAGLAPEQVSNPRSGLVAGSGGASSFNQVWAADTLRAKGIKRVGPFMVTRTMGSTVSACLATPFGIKGVNYSITSACATSAHCIGHAAQLIAWGQQDVVFAGGGEERAGSCRCCSTRWAPCPAAATTRRTRPPAPSMPGATVLSSPAAAACWCWSRWSMPRRAAPTSWPSWWASAPPRTATTWSRPPARVRCAACSRR